MYSAKCSVAILLLLNALSAVRSLPAITGQDALNDVFQNEVLPPATNEASPNTATQKTAPSSPVGVSTLAASSGTNNISSPINLITSTPNGGGSPPASTVPRPNTQRQTYFSQVVTSIFEIPIAVLNAVRNLLNTAGGRNVVNRSSS